MQAAVDAGLDVIALTDHDTTDGWASAVGHVDVVRGAEISCTHEGTSLHLLAYLFDPLDAALAHALQGLRDSRVGRAERMVQRLVADGHPVTWEQVQGIAGGTVGRPHVARALIDVGLVGSIDEAFTPEWIGTGGRYWAGKDELDVMEAISLVRAAGGVTVFAHPAAASRGRIVGEEAIEQMAAAGLDGLEVDHPDHPADVRRRMREVASALQLIPTGSSDFHGSNKDVQLGAHLTDEGAYEALVARATGVPVLSCA
jgi:predicted metal-dependent phosphoesterase TrpH